MISTACPIFSIGSVSNSTHEPLLGSNSQRCRNNDAGETKPSARQIEQRPVGFSIDGDKALPRMKKGQFFDDIREATFAVLILAVHIPGDAATDRQVRIAGKDGNCESPRQEKLQQLA